VFTPPRRFLAALLMFSLAALGVVFASTPHGGLAISPDSLHYISASQHILAGEGYLRYEANAYTHWPPLYPLVIALVERLAGAFGIELMPALRILQALTYAGIVFASGLLFRRHLRSTQLALLGTLAVLLAFPLLRITVFAWSEPLFVLLVLLFFLYLPRFLTQPSLWTAAAVGALAALAFLQRYIGVTLAAAGGLTILLFAQASWRQRMRCAVIYSMLIAAALVPWFIRNVAVSGSPTGRRGNFGTAPDEVFGKIVETVRPWFIGGDGAVNAFAGILVVVVGLALLVALVYKQRRQIPYGDAPLSIGLFALLTLLALMGTAITVGFDAMDQRLLVPLYVPAMLLIFIALEQAANALSGRFGRPAYAAVIAATALWLLYPASALVHEVGTFSDWCCQADVWRGSAVTRWLQANPLNGAVYSNTTLPLFMGVNVRKSPDDLDDLAARAAANAATYFVWMDERYKDTCAPGGQFCYNTTFDEAALSEAFTVELVSEMDDGRVYRLVTR
jgi:hypothetical protein